MIQPAKPDPFMDDQRVLDALRQARNAAVRLHAANGQPMIGWKDGKLFTTDAVITEHKEKGKGGYDDHDHGGMDY